MMRRLSILMLLLLTGCASSSSWERTATASSVGCKPEQVSVVRKDSGAFDSIQSWYADCRGTRYRCVFVPGDKGGCYPVNASG
jgi:hypothetical protein